MAEAPPGKGRCVQDGGSLAPGPGPLPAPGTGVRTHGRPHPRGVPSTDGVGTGGGEGSRVSIPSSQSPRSANAPHFCQTSLFSLPRTRRSASPLSPGLYFFFFPSGILRSPLESGPFSSRFGWEKGIPSSPPPFCHPLPQRGAGASRGAARSRPRARRRGAPQAPDPQRAPLPGAVWENGTGSAPPGPPPGPGEGQKIGTAPGGSGTRGPSSRPGGSPAGGPGRL